MRHKHILLVIIIALTFRLAFFPNYNFMPDEALHAYVARSITQGCFITTMYYHPAITYLYPLASVFLIFGATELAARFLSIILGLASIIILYATTKQIFNKKIAFISSTILAITPIHIFLSTQAMIDILTNLLFISAFYFLVKLHETKLNKYLYYIAIIFALGINNKFNIILLIPLLFFYFILFKPKLKLKPIIISVLLAFIISLPTILSILAVNSIGYSPSITSYVETANFGQGVVENSIFYLNSFFTMNGLFVILFLAAFIFSIYYNTKKDKNKWVTFLLLWIIFIFIFFSLAPGIRFERYIFLTIPPLAILSGLLINKSPKLEIVIVIIIFAILSISHSSSIQTDNYNWNVVGQYISQNTKPGDLIYTDQGWLINFYADRYATSYLNYDDLNNPPSNLKYIIIKSNEFSKNRTREHALFVNQTFSLETQIADFFVYSANGSSESFTPKPFCINIYLEILHQCNYNVSCLSKKITDKYEPSSPI